MSFFFTRAETRKKPGCASFGSIFFTDPQWRHHMASLISAISINLPIHGRMVKKMESKAMILSKLLNTLANYLIPVFVEQNRI